MRGQMRLGRLVTDDGRITVNQPLDITKECRLPTLNAQLIVEGVQH